MGLAVARCFALLVASLAALVSPPPALGGEFSLRGVIFGPYGRPWSHEDRMSVIEWMARPEVGMNVYVHAPKNDVYQRLQWREPYPAEVLEEFLQEAAFAAARGVEWVTNLSPGVPLVPSPRLPTAEPSRDACFSCEEDLDLIEAKLLPFYVAGANTLMISFDDVQKLSTHPQDAATHGVGDEAYGRMNATLLNEILERFRQRALQDGREVSLLTVPADYSGTVQTDYLKGFSAVIDCDVRVMWTGVAVVSHQVSSEDAGYYRDAVWPENGRCHPANGERPKLLLWDNFPVNDYNGNFFSGSATFEGFRAGEQPNEVVVTPQQLGFAGAEVPAAFKLNVGPYKGRRSDLTEHVAGILANPMNEAEASKIPLFTVARYLRNPDPYTAAPSPNCPEDPDEDPADDDAASCKAEADWADSIDDFGGDFAEPLRDFVDQMRSTPFDRTESPVFERLHRDLEGAFSTAFWREAWWAVVEELERERAAATTLHDPMFPNPRFVHEARHHLAQLGQNAEVGLRAASLLSAERPSLTVDPPEPGSVPGTFAVTGSVAPVDPVLAARLLAELAPAEVQMRVTPYSVHGDRFQHDLGAVYVAENRMDAFTNWVRRETAVWLPLAPRAATGPLEVTVAGEPATVSMDGSFWAVVAPAPGATTVDVVVTDAAGKATGERVPLPQ